MCHACRLQFLWPVLPICNVSCHHHQQATVTEPQLLAFFAVGMQRNLAAFKLIADVAPYVHRMSLH